MNRHPVDLTDPAPPRDPRRAQIHARLTDLHQTRTPRRPAPDAHANSARIAAARSYGSVASTSRHRSTEPTNAHQCRVSAPNHTDEPGNPRSKPATVARTTDSTGTPSHTVSVSTGTRTLAAASGPNTTGDAEPLDSALQMP